MLTTDLYTVASWPSASGDLSVPDPSPAEAERAIAENVLGSGERASHLNGDPYVSSLNYQFPLDTPETEMTTVIYGGHVWDPVLGRKRAPTEAEHHAGLAALERQTKRLTLEGKRAHVAIGN